ncbi:hypothetical protein DFJ73DRAFT_871489 [Zopfochytrium polystomum]|nr:hypothetical protein DFJ73DRAFT_871489 [Zopfochytrium polystomum]
MLQSDPAQRRQRRQRPPQQQLLLEQAPPATYATALRTQKPPTTFPTVRSKQRKRRGNSAPSTRSNTAAVASTADPPHPVTPAAVAAEQRSPNDAKSALEPSPAATPAPASQSITPPKPSQPAASPSPSPPRPAAPLPRLQLPRGVCVKVAHLRPRFDNLQAWRSHPGHVLVTRAGRIFITDPETRKSRPYVYEASPWANPFKLSQYSLQESLRRFRAHLEELLKDPGTLNALGAFASRGATATGTLFWTFLGDACRGWNE